MRYHNDREAVSSMKVVAAVLAAALVAVLGTTAFLGPVRAASSTVSFTCLPQAQAYALVTANPPGAMSPDTSSCPGFYDGYYTPSATSTTTSTTVTSTPTTSAAPVTGVGTVASITVVTTAFFPAPDSTTANPLFITCTGESASPTTTNAPYQTITAGTSTLSGILTTNAPGTIQTYGIRNPCVSSATSSYIFTFIAFATYNSVTLKLPNGQTFTGGISWTSDTTYGNSFGNSTTGASQYLQQITLTGTGGLAGMTAIGDTSTQNTRTNGISVSTTVYWVQLSNVP